MSCKSTDNISPWSIDGIGWQVQMIWSMSKKPGDYPIPSTFKISVWGGRD
jgi:hypothetical protein